MQYIPLEPNRDKVKGIFITCGLNIRLISQAYNNLNNNIDQMAKLFTYIPCIKFTTIPPAHRVIFVNFNSPIGRIVQIKITESPEGRF